MTIIASYCEGTVAWCRSQGIVALAAMASDEGGVSKGGRPEGKMYEGKLYAVRHGNAGHTLGHGISGTVRFDLYGDFHSRGGCSGGAQSDPASAEDAAWAQRAGIDTACCCHSPAGAGYVYRAAKLDRNKVRQFTDGMRPSPTHVQKRLTAEVTANQAAYKDPSGLEFYGASDADGIITTSTVPQSQGVWLKGARLDLNSASLSGGEPAAFDGTASSPSYWLVTFVAAPKGVTVRTDACVIQLPNLATANGSPLFQVDVYPKLDIKDSHVLPGNKVKPNGGLAHTGVSLLVPAGLTSLFLILGTALILAERRRAGSN